MKDMEECEMVRMTRLQRAPRSAAPPPPLPPRKRIGHERWGGEAFSARQWDCVVGSGQSIPASPGIPDSLLPKLASSIVLLGHP